jgi:hypothetical protein
LAIRPNTATPWLYHTGQSFTPILARWIATGIMSILTDLIVTGMSIYLVWDLNMASKSKSLVITAFTLRLFVMPVTVTRLVTLSHVDVTNLSFSYSLPEVMTQLEMYCNLITTTLPCLRLFLTAWNSSFMDIGLAGIDHDAYRERKIYTPSSLSPFPLTLPSFYILTPIFHRRRNNPQQLHKQRCRLGLQVWCSQQQEPRFTRRGSRRLGSEPYGEIEGFCRDWRLA